MKSNKEIIASMELNLEILWERYYRNNLKMKFETDEKLVKRYKERAERASVEAENAGYSYGALLRDLGIKKELDIYNIMIRSLRLVNEMYKEELQEMEKRVG